MQQLRRMAMMTICVRLFVPTKSGALPAYLTSRADAGTSSPRLHLERSFRGGQAGRRDVDAAQRCHAVAACPSYR